MVTLKGDSQRLADKIGGLGVRGELKTVASKSGRRQLRSGMQEIPRNWVTGRAYDLHIQLQQEWSKLGGPLLAAKTEEEVKAAFEEFAKPYTGNFVPGRISDIFTLIKDKKFPKKQEAQINFLADSLGGRPNLSLRSSRDICEKERAK